MPGPGELCPATVRGILIGAVFVSVYLAAFHEPSPHQPRVGTTEVGAQQVELSQELEHAIPGAISLVT